ncbi:hypothetical protein ONS96_009962 [Cadophora gregata f. sp. sojae]|nr:hypothetical protein ONS96_009962 [Cadophora gregata f. sp. sojae]
MNIDRTPFPISDLIPRAVKAASAVFKKIRHTIGTQTPEEVAMGAENRERRKRCQRWIESGGYVTGYVGGASRTLSMSVNNSKLWKPIEDEGQTSNVPRFSGDIQTLEGRVSKESRIKIHYAWMVRVGHVSSDQSRGDTRRNYS